MLSQYIARIYDNYVVTIPVVAIFQFNPNTYTVDEDVAGGTQAVSLQLVSGTLATSIGIQVTVTGGTATAIGMYQQCVETVNRALTLLGLQSKLLEI